MSFQERFKKLKEYKKERMEQFIQKIEKYNQKIAQFGPLVKDVCKQFSKATDLKLEIHEYEFFPKSFKGQINEDKKIKQAGLSLFLVYGVRNEEGPYGIYVNINSEYNEISIKPSLWNLFRSEHICFSEFTKEKLAGCLEAAYKQLVREQTE